MLFEKDQEKIYSNFHNCFNGQIPKTGHENKHYLWFSTDIQERKSNDEKISYEFNNYGYRCQSFERKGINVLTLGCSIGFGNGVPEHKRFSKIFCNEIGNNVNDWNLSWPGVSIDYVTRMIITCVPILKPDIVLINFPHLPRKEFFDATGHMFAHRPDRKTTNLKDQGLQQSHLSISSSYQDAYRLITNYKAIEKINEDYNVKWFFSVKESDLDQYQKIHQYFDEQKFVKPLKKIDFARDGGHPGIESNKNFAFNYLEKYNV